MSQHFNPPTSGTPLSMGDDGKLNVPDNPIIPFIEGDGTGPDIWRASQRVFDAAVEKAYGGKRQDRLDGGLRRREGLQRVRAAGCPTRPSRPSASTSSASRAR